MGVVKTGEEDEVAKHKIANQQSEFFVARS
jgi:hypothetical protein